MNNYHYYLKSEFYPPSGASPRFTCIRWHPEKENVIYLAGEGELSCSSVDRAHRFVGFVQQRTIEWETVSSLLPVPQDTGSVFVVDGGESEVSVPIGADVGRSNPRHIVPGAKHPTTNVLIPAQATRTTDTYRSLSHVGPSRRLAPARQIPSMGPPYPDPQARKQGRRENRTARGRI